MTRLPNAGRTDLRIDHVVQPPSEPLLAAGCDATKGLGYIGRRDKVLGNTGKVVSVPNWHLVPAPRSDEVPDAELRLIVMWVFYDVRSDVGQVAGLIDTGPRRDMTEQP